MMLNEFSVGFRTAERDIDKMVPLSMSAEGVGAATYLIAFLAGSRTAGAFGLALVLLGATALFAHLGHPLRSWRVVAAAGRAWMSRGAVFTAGLILCGVPALLFHGDNLQLLLLHTVALSCTLVVVLYAGLLFASISAVPFWNSSLFPIVLVLHSLSSAGLLIITVLSLGSGGLAPHLRECGLVLALLASTLALTWTFTDSAPRSEAAQESVRLLTAGRLKSLFQQGALRAGLIAPLLLVLLAYLLGGAPILSGLLLVIALLLRLAGDVSLRYALLRAGVYAPVI